VCKRCAAMYMSRADMTAVSVVLQRALISVKGRCVDRDARTEILLDARTFIGKAILPLGSWELESGQL
jgi:hypothetical protein